MRITCAKICYCWYNTLWPLCHWFTLMNTLKTRNLLTSDIETALPSQPRALIICHRNKLCIREWIDRTNFMLDRKLNISTSCLCANSTWNFCDRKLLFHNSNICRYSADEKKRKINSNTYRQRPLRWSCPAVRLLWDSGRAIAWLCPTPWWWLCHRRPCRTVKTPPWTRRFVLLSVGQPGGR